MTLSRRINCINKPKSSLYTTIEYTLELKNTTKRPSKTLEPRGAPPPSPWSGELGMAAYSFGLYISVLPYSIVLKIWVVASAKIL